mmetsp:Transcript_51032/g.160101  ORF Transcript_51032/g.160101 Transcript_51032/m.160101 type:complete len:201 (+) Transcript_51032:1565-2167(+)
MCWDTLLKEAASDRSLDGGMVLCRRSGLAAAEWASAPVNCKSMSLLLCARSREAAARSASCTDMVRPCSARCGKAIGKRLGSARKGMSRPSHRNTLSQRPKPPLMRNQPTWMSSGLPQSRIMLTCHSKRSLQRVFRRSASTVTPRESCSACRLRYEKPCRVNLSLAAYETETSLWPLRSDLIAHQTPNCTTLLASTKKLG